MIHPAEQSDDDLLADCTMRRTKRSGPGGQHRNKVETAVVLTHEPSGVLGEASERRSQAQNRGVAVFRLRVNLALAVREVRSEPSERWRRRCPHGRIAVSPEHDDFPALLAEALDVLAQTEWDPKAAAEFLACTPTQLLKLLKLEPRAFQQLNAERIERNLHPLQ